MWSTDFPSSLFCCCLLWYNVSRFLFIGEEGEQMAFYPLKLHAPLKDYLWGGTRLREEYGKETDMDKVAESWELSCHKDGESIIAEGEDKGLTLREYIEREGKQVLGSRCEKLTEFPLLIKFIDARDSLSVQVHPDNEYAERVEGEQGKTEMWYIMDAEPGAKLIYGFEKEISKDEFRSRIEEGNLLEVCSQVPVKKGDVFFIEAGTLHAIGAGILICEVQQSSNSTYRVYDYGRVGADGKSRPLHIGKALAVTKRKRLPLDTKPLAEFDLFKGCRASLLAKCDYFTTYHLEMDGETEFRAPKESFQSLTVLSGKLKLICGDREMELAKGETAFLPVGMGDYALAGAAECLLVER